MCVVSEESDERVKGRESLLAWVRRLSLGVCWRRERGVLFGYSRTSERILREHTHTSELVSWGNKRQKKKEGLTL